MKKLLLVISSIVLTTGAIAQLRLAPGVKLYPSTVPMRSEKVTKIDIVTEAAPVKQSGIPSVTSSFTPSTASFPGISETKIGETQYDLQSNRNPGRRITNNGNGTFSAVWTMIPTGGVSGDRGTGYNHYDGTAWGAFPTARVEYKRTGFTNIDMVNGNEYILAHTGDSGLIVSKRTVGTGAWSYFAPVGTFNLHASQADVWGKLAVGGANGMTIHAIVNSQGTGTTPVLNQSGPLTYSRSQDGGATWDIDHIRLPDCDENFYLGFSAENYNIDARGDVVAIVAGGFEQDITLWKSTDNGTTWVKTVLLQFPLPLYDASVAISDVDGDSVADTIETASEDPTVSLDNNGVAHVAMGRMFVLDDDVAALSSYFPTTDGLWYWNETMTGGPVIVAGAEDLNGNTFIDLPEPVAPNTQPLGLYGTAGMITHPSIGFDDNNAVYLSYAAPNELADTLIFQCAHRHTYVIGSADMGATWSTPYNIVPDQAAGGDGEFQEGVYASIARKVVGSGSTAHAHIVYQRDGAPYVSSVFGALSTSATVAAQQSWNADAGNIPFPNDIIYADVTGIITVGINENKNSIVVNVAPNPATDFVTISFNMPKSENVSLQMTDVLGRVVVSNDLGIINAGDARQFVDVSKLTSGAYMFTLSSASFRSTGKVVIK
jgi:Secretion system C-terminal sorting domain